MQPVFFKLPSLRNTSIEKWACVARMWIVMGMDTLSMKEANVITAIQHFMEIGL